MKKTSQHERVKDLTVNAKAISSFRSEVLELNHLEGDISEQQIKALFGVNSLIEEPYKTSSIEIMMIISALFSSQPWSNLHASIFRKNKEYFKSLLLDFFFVSSEFQNINDDSYEYLAVIKNIHSTIRKMIESFMILHSELEPDDKLRTMIEFFLVNYKKNTLPNRRKTLNKRVDYQFESSNYKIPFTLVALTDSWPVHGGYVQAVVPNADLSEVDSKHIHLPNSPLDEFQKLYSEIDPKIANDLSKIVFSDPLLFIPENCSDKFKRELEKMIGLFVEAIYDFAAPIHFNFRDIIGKFVFDFNSAYKEITKMRPTMSLDKHSEKFVRGRANDSYNIFSAASNGLNIALNYEDLYSFVNYDFSFDNPLKLVEKMEKLLRKRLNSNYQVLLEQIKKVTNMAVEEVVKNLIDGGGSVSSSQKVLLKLRIGVIYSSWLLMLLDQYKTVILNKVLAYKKDIRVYQSKKY